MNGIHRIVGPTILLRSGNYFDFEDPENSVITIDAARELHKAVLPHHYAQLHMWPMPEMTRVDIGGGHVGRDNIPARAWLIAILRALIAKEGET